MAGLCFCAIAPALALGADAALPDGPGKKTVEAVCSGCHSLDVITNKNWDRGQWQRSVQVMEEFGARLSKKQASEAVEYLTANFGVKDRGRELVEDVCTYCHGLQKLEGQERSREEWRDLIKGMIFEGAPVTDEEFSLILDYLVKNYGKKGP
jgi:cytochrome c5